MHWELVSRVEPSGLREQEQAEVGLVQFSKEPHVYTFPDHFY